MGRLHVSTWKCHHQSLPELVRPSKTMWKKTTTIYFNIRETVGLEIWHLLSFCPVPVKRACGAVRACLALLPRLLAWSQSFPVPADAASPLSGCATTRTTVETVRMRSVHPPAPRSSSDVPAARGDSWSPAKTILLTSTCENAAQLINNWIEKVA